MLSKTKKLHDSVVKTPPGISPFCWEIVVKFLSAVVDFATFLAVRGVPDERPPSPLRSVENIGMTVVAVDHPVFGVCNMC